MVRKPFTAVAVALLLVLAGCAGAGGGGLQSKSQATGQQSADTSYSGGDSAAEGTPGAQEDAGGSAPAVQDRELIRIAELTIEVDSFERARDSLTEYADSTGGYVGDSTQEVRGQGNQTWIVGTITLRIPASNYSEALATVNETGTVVSSSQKTRDVTDQVVDLEARLKNLRAERDRLRELYQQANDTEDVLAVQRELSRVQEQIERTEAQLRQLERKVAFTTITVHVRERPPEDPDDPDPAWYETSVVTAFLESIDGVILFLRGSVVLAAYALPYLLVLGLPLVGGVFLFRRYRNSGRGRESETVPPEDAAGVSEVTPEDEIEDEDEDEE
jgi:hypothetical protein